MRKFYLKRETKTKPFCKHWQFCVGSGHAGLALRADYIRLLKECAEDLGIQRVRFHGIFCDDMHTMHKVEDILPFPIDPGIREMSFRLCGVAYDNLLEAGVKPFVELSFMPSAMAKEDVRSMFFYKPNICLPKNDEEWTSYIESFLKFLLERYGKEEVEQWYFEVWNEPDLVAPFFHGTQEDYFHLYEITARAIKKTDPNLRVGGPATSGSKWVSAFVRYCMEHHVPVDFITTHQYAGDPLGGVSDDGGPDAEKDESMQENQEKALSEFLMKNMEEILVSVPRDSLLPVIRGIMGDPLETEETPNNVFATNAPIVKEQAGGLPVYYTEWNTCATFGAYSNDTRKVAAYDVKTCLQLDGVVDGSSIWCFSDIFEELHPFPEEFHGGFGLMTQSGIKKPVYYALQMLQTAGNLRYDIPDELEHEVSIAAFQGNGEIQLILTRQMLKNRFDLPKEVVDIQAELTRVPQKVVLNRIDDKHCNPLEVWEDMGSPQTPTLKQVQEIKECSDMVDELLEYTYDAGVFKTEVALGINDVYFIRITL